MYWPNVTQESVQPVEKSPYLTYMSPYTKRCCSSKPLRCRYARLKVAGGAPGGVDCRVQWAYHQSQER